MIMTDKVINRTNRRIQQVQAEAINEEQNQYLAFNLDNEIYGLEILCIREIIEYESVTHVPLSPAYIRGVINMRGKVVPVADLLCLFDHAPIEITRRSCIVILETKTKDKLYEIGMLVDSVVEVVEIQPQEIDSPPSFGTKINVSCIKGMGKTDRGFVIILDPDLFLSLDQLYHLADNYEQHTKKEAKESQSNSQNENIIELKNSKGAN